MVVSDYQNYLKDHINITNSSSAGLNTFFIFPVCLLVIYPPQSNFIIFLDLYPAYSTYYMHKRTLNCTSKSSWDNLNLIQVKYQFSRDFQIVIASHWMPSHLSAWWELWPHWIFFPCLGWKSQWFFFIFLMINRRLSYLGATGISTSSFSISFSTP